MSNRSRQVLRDFAGHHAWCRPESAHGCKCEVLHRDYPFLPGETPARAVARYWPLRDEPEAIEADPELRIIKRGREILRPTEAMEEAIVQLGATRAEMERYLREDSVTLRRIDSKTGEEIERVEQTRTVKINSFKSRTDKLVLDTDNHRREVRKVATIISKLEKGNHLERDLAIVLNQLARRVADGHGAATLDGDDSTNRLTSPYEPIGTKSGFGSKTPSDAQLEGQRCLQQMKENIPPRLMKIFNQIVDEETAGWHDRARTLTQMGEAIGYEKSQASSAGGGLVYAVCCIIEHFMRKNGYLTFGNTRMLRQVDADA